MITDQTQTEDPRAKLIQLATKLATEDAQFRDSFPKKEVTAAKMQPGLRLAQVVQIAMEGYAERPALGQRARELITDPVSGRRTLQLLPRFDTITYRELWARARAVASDWHHNDRHPLKAGDFVCILGFTSPEYATLLLANIHVGAVSVPLQTSASVRNHADIIAETQAHTVAVSIDYVDAAVNAVLAGFVPRRLVIMDVDARDDDQRDKVAAARKRLVDAACTITVDTLDAVISRAQSLPVAPLYVPAAGEDPLSWLFYTSGSTGTPKGAIFTERLTITTWLTDLPMPVITLSFMPMAHLVGNGFLLLALANGGTSYCSPKSDLSTLFEDFSLARPTMTSLVPRVCELFHHHFLGEVDRRVAAGADAETVAVEIKQELREKVLGGRLMSVGCGSASLAPETYVFMESMLDMHMSIGYSSTEIAGGTVLVDWKVQRPPVIDYKLADVPELGYFRTDKPYPRGELLVKSDRFMGGYYKQPDLTAEKYDEDGFYRTGDVMAELGPDHLVYVDRRNNVVKLSQGEFVAISRLEAIYSHSPEIRQIYIYGTSERSYLLAVIVPSDELTARLVSRADTVKAELRRALKHIADEQKLNGYEIPRDFIVETEPFSLKNGLLTEIGKHQRPNLKARYGEQLEQLYVQIAQGQLDELRALRTSGADKPVLETVTRALRAIVGASSVEILPEDKYADLGGDSLSALEFSKLLEDIYHMEVPVGVILNPAGNVRGIASHIDAERKSGVIRPTFARVHGRNATAARAAELALDKFIDRELIANASTLPQAGDESRTVLLTGATGYLGRFLALSWLERLGGTGGKLVLVARGVDAAQARQRVEAALDTDTELMAHFRHLAAKHLEVVPGDLGAHNLGLDAETWNRLAQSVDVIVHSGAHVNHVLPYNQLFAANVAGTAELIRLAITTKRKRFHYISTLGVSALGSSLVDEDSDIRQAVSTCEINSGYANGYGISKWASEVLLREAFDLCGVPVSVFRPGMILAHSRYQGQLNVPDMFTRLLLSLAVTGVAPATFYAQDLSQGRPAGRYEGFAADFLADTITAIGSRDTQGFHTYNLSSPHDDCASLDNFVDWLVDAGCTIERIGNYNDWLARFETAMHALSEEQRQQSLLALLGPYRNPQMAGTKSLLSTARFSAAAKAAGVEIPRLSAAMINKYVADLRHLRMLK
jgi:fatty acid CoA ligase FadD9